MDKRLDEMNKFREQLRDQAATFVRTDAFESFKDERRHALSTLEDNNDKRIEELRHLIATEREERRASEGAKRGSSATTGSLVTAITVTGAVLAIIVVVLNLLTRAP
jgi:hypothetical protein